MAALAVEWWDKNMTDPKPFASLTPSLLARKGTARPAMRPQGYINFAQPTGPNAEDLGWNDMGHDPLPVVALPGHDVPAGEPVVPPPVVQQQADLAAQMASTSADAQAGLRRAVPGSRGKAAFTLRLDPDRHLRLRLLSAVSHKSAQHIVTAALDAALELHDLAIEAATAVTRKG